MKFVDFPQRNVLLAEDQPEYQTLPVHVRYGTTPGDVNEKGEQIQRPYDMTAVMEFTDEQIADIVAKKRIYYRQMVFGNPFQPIFISTKNPFEPGNEQHWPAD
jgi:hypothetical protein